MHNTFHEYSEPITASPATQTRTKFIAHSRYRPHNTQTSCVLALDAQQSPASTRNTAQHTLHIHQPSNSLGTNQAPYAHTKGALPPTYEQQARSNHGQFMLWFEQMMMLLLLLRCLVPQTFLESYSIPLQDQTLQMRAQT